MTVISEWVVVKNEDKTHASFWFNIQLYLGLVYWFCVFAIKSLELTTDRVQFPHHHHHDMYLQLYQHISVITACISPACICGNLQCGLLHDTGLPLLQIITTNYYSKSFNLLRRILNKYNSSWNTNWEYGELFQRSLYFKIIICNCSLQCSCTVHWPGGVLDGGCLIVLWGQGLYLMVWWLIAAITWLRSSHSNKFIELLALGGWL